MRGINTLTLNRASLEEAFKEYLARQLVGVKASDIHINALRYKASAGHEMDIDFEIKQPKVEQS